MRVIILCLSIVALNAFAESKLYDVGLCVDEVCSHLSSLDCNESDEVLKVASSCQGTYSMGCFRSAIARLGSVDYNELDEITSIVKACNYNYSGSCLDAVCGRLGPLDCNERMEVNAIAQSCQSDELRECGN